MSTGWLTLIGAVVALVGFGLLAAVIPTWAGISRLGALAFAAVGLVVVVVGFAFIVRANDVDSARARAECARRGAPWQWAPPRGRDPIGFCYKPEP